MQRLSVTSPQHASSPAARPCARGRESEVGAVPFEMLLGVATILALGAGKPAPTTKLPDVVKSRIKLIELYCSTDAKSLLHTTATGKMEAAKRAPCQARAIKSHIAQVSPSHSTESPQSRAAAGLSEDAGGDRGGEEEGHGGQEQGVYAGSNAHRQEGHVRYGLQKGLRPPSPQTWLLRWH